MKAIGKRNSLARAAAVLMLLVSWRDVWADTAHDELGETAVTHRVNSGAVWAWGYNGFGELADGTALQPATSVQVAGLAGLPAVAAGNGFVPPIDDSPRWASQNHVRRYQDDGKPSLRSAFGPASGTAATAAIARVTFATLFAGNKGVKCGDLMHVGGGGGEVPSRQGSHTVRQSRQTDFTGLTGGNTIS